MASPIVLFTAGMGTVVVALGAGFAGSHFLVSPPAQAPLQTVLTERPNPPPPTVERVERETETHVGGPIAETTGAGSAWVTEVPQAIEERKPPIAPTIPYLAPIATTVDPPLIVEKPAPSTSPVTERPSPVTAGLKPAGPAPEVHIKPPARPVDVKLTAPPKVRAEAPPKSNEETEKRKRATRVESDKKREREATRARQAEIERDRKKKGVVVERWRERIEEDDDEPRPRRSGNRDDPPRDIAPQRDFFSILFGGRD
jgi:hypothetical protein